MAWTEIDQADVGVLEMLVALARLHCDLLLWSRARRAIFESLGGAIIRANRVATRSGRVRRSRAPVTPSTGAPAWSRPRETQARARSAARSAAHPRPPSRTRARSPRVRARAPARCRGRRLVGIRRDRAPAAIESSAVRCPPVPNSWYRHLRFGV